jgi:hypothetical protein
VTDAESDRQPAAPAALAAHKPARWLVLQASALLESVASANYTCYGRVGVPTYPVERPTPPDAAPVLCAEMLLRGPDDVVRLACLDLEFALTRQDDWQVAWSVYVAPRQLQVLWVWDFYRILSHAVLRLRLPRKDQHAEVDEAWQGGLDALRAVAPGDVIEFSVRSACGDIHQLHPVTASPVEWEPAGTHGR